MDIGAERPLDEFIATFSPEWQAIFREDIEAGRMRRVVAREPGEPWALYELDPERGVARVAQVGE